MSVILLLADPVEPFAEARASSLELRVLQTAPGGEDVTVSFRPNRSDDLYASAKMGAKLAYRILYREGIVRSQLAIRFEAQGVATNVVGRSADLAFALAILLRVYEDGDHDSRYSFPIVAATGVLESDGTIRPVEHAQAKLRAALSEASTEPTIVFFPAENLAAVEEARFELPPTIKLCPVRHLDEALDGLGITLEHIYLRCPFRGLEPFEYEHHAVFFGREADIRSAAQQLLRREAARRPGLLIEGPSGSGKSSFLRAGLLPTLVNPREQSRETREALQARPVSAQVRRAIWRPGLLPSGVDEVGMAESIRECWAAFTEWPSEWRREPVRSLLELAELSRAAWPKSSRFVWVIDQFEQILTLGLKDAALEGFGRFLSVLQSQGFWTLASVRADAMPQLKRYETFRQVFGTNEGQYYLSTLSGIALDSVIALPARAADLVFGRTADGRTLDQLLREDAYTATESLPLLQFTLNELYSRRAGNSLTYEAYREIGGLAGSIATIAAGVLESEDVESRRAARRLFRSLITVDETGSASRRYAPIDEATREPEQKHLLDRLVQARLCVTDEQEGKPVVAFTHDSLLHTLPALTEWLNEENALLQSRDLAQRETRLWRQHGESNAWLAAADKVAAFGALQAAEMPLPQDVRTFIDRSKRQLRRTTRLKQAAVTLIAFLGVGASIAAWVAQRQRHEALYQTAQAVKAQMSLLTEAAAERLKDGDISIARAVILEVLRRTSPAQPDPASVNVFQELRAGDPAAAILAGHRWAVRRAAYSPDGTRIVTASADGTARIWDARTGIEERVLLGHTGPVLTAAWSPDGVRIVTASFDGTARVWDARSGRVLLILHARPGALKIDGASHAGGIDAADPVALTAYDMADNKELSACATYSPDGSRIATVSNNEVRVWSARSGVLLVTLSSPEVTFGIPGADGGYAGSVGYSPDGTRIVTTMGDRTARIWDARTGHMIATLIGHTDKIATAAYSPDGKRIITGGDQTARIWDASTGRMLQVLSGHAGYVWQAVYSPDGALIGTASTDRTARIWDARTGMPLRVLSGDAGGGLLSDVEFSPDGSHLITSGGDQTARTWDLRVGPAAATLSGHQDQVTDVVYSPDGSRLATSSMDKTVRTWDALAGKQLLLLPGRGEDFNSVAYSTDGTRIVTGSTAKVARIWDARTGAPITSLTGAPGPVVWATYSPDGRRIVASFLLSFGVWDTRSQALRIIRSGHRDEIHSAVFSPDGRLILTASVDKTARLWDASTLKPIGILPHGEYVHYAVFSPDSTRILTAVNDGTARLWDTRSQAQIAVLSGHHNRVVSAAFSPDGRYVATGSWDKTVRIWDVRDGAQLAVLAGHRDAVLSVAYSPDGSRIASASRDKADMIWDARVAGSLKAQVLWEQAAESDTLTDVVALSELPPTAVLLADSTLRSSATNPGAGDSRTDATPCDRQAADFLDSQRRAQGLAEETIDPAFATEACSLRASARHASARDIYQYGRALIAAGDFAGGRRQFVSALSLGYRAARVGLARLLTNPRAGMLDPAHAIALYEKAWEDGIPFAGFALGQVYEHGVMTPDGTALLAKNDRLAWSWYRAAASAGEPDALARFAREEETEALASSSRSAEDARLFEAFQFYAAAAEFAREADWPDNALRVWRYRRATLARVLGADGMMEQVAKAYELASRPGAGTARVPISIIRASSRDIDQRGLGNSTAREPSAQTRARS